MCICGTSRQRTITTHRQIFTAIVNVSMVLGEVCMCIVCVWIVSVHVYTFLINRDSGGGALEPEWDPWGWRRI